MKRIHTTLAKMGYSIMEVQLGLGSKLDAIPYIILSQDVYPGVEAHLFTIADAALWIPALTTRADVILYRPRSFDEDKGASAVEQTRCQAWEKMLASFKRMSSILAPYRERLREGYIPTDIWVHYDSEWHRNIREAPEPEPRPVREFIHYVDPSIRTHIRALNENGFSTIESCSGLPNEHLDRSPYRPYVMFDERAYLGVGAHIFTLADIAGWIPCCAPHGFDIVIQQRIDDEIEDAWNRLIVATRVLSDLLTKYRAVLRDPVNQFKLNRKQSQAFDSFGHEILEEKTQLQQ